MVLVPTHEQYRAEPQDRPSRDPEALIREAHRRRRRRRLGIAAAIVAALALLLGGLALAGTGGGRPAQPPQRRTPAHASSSSADHARGRAPFTVPAQPGITAWGQAGPGVDWAAGATALYVSTDAGEQWRAVTPPNLANQFVGDRMTAVDAVGPDDLWVVLEDVPGLVPWSQAVDGSDRGEGIDRSTDGGRTWTFDALPDCLQRCGPIWLSFVDAQHGFAAVSSAVGIEGNGEPANLFATADGGASWTPIATPPDFGAVTTGGRALPQFVFTSAEDGWAVTGPREASASAPASPGGALYRTTDGGRSWTAATGLPRAGPYALPTFFGPGDGVVLRDASETVPARPATAQRQPLPSVYVTNDGGTSWTRRTVPAAVAHTEPWTSTLASRFSAASPTTWKVDDSTLLFTTTDGGRRWTASSPTPEVFASGALFSSPDDDVVIGSPATCIRQGGPDPAQGCADAVVLATTDGGRSWEPARF